MVQPEAPLSKAPRRRPTKKVAALSLALAAVLALGWCDFRGEPARQVTQVQSLRQEALLLAGGGKARILPVQGVEKAGYPPRRPEAQPGDVPLHARALVLQAGDATLALVSMDLLEIPEALSEEIRRAVASLGVDDVVVAATHVHSSVGGYDHNLAARLAATGSFSPDQFRNLVQTAVDAIGQGKGNLRPVTLRGATSLVSGVKSINRSEKGGPVGGQLSLLALDDLVTGAPVATAFTFEAHATTLPRRSPTLDPDFPGRAASIIEEATGATALFFQGAAGDQRAEPLDDGKGSGTGEAKASQTYRAERIAALLADTALSIREYAKSLDASLGMEFHRGTFNLPKAQAPSTVPGALVRPSSRILDAILMDTAQLEILSLGGLTIAFVPGEPTWYAGQNLRRFVSRRMGGVPRERVPLVSLANGYVGYMESGQRRREGVGESKRSLWEADLESRMTEALGKLLPEAPSPGSPAAGKLPALPAPSAFEAARPRTHPDGGEDSPSSVTSEAQGEAPAGSPAPAPQAPSFPRAQ